MHSKTDKLGHTKKTTEMMTETDGSVHIHFDRTPIGLPHREYVQGCLTNVFSQQFGFLKLHDQLFPFLDVGTGGGFRSAGSNTDKGVAGTVVLPGWSVASVESGTACLS